MNVQLRETYCCHCRKSVDFQTGSPESYKRTDFKKCTMSTLLRCRGRKMLQVWMWPSLTFDQYCIQVIISQRVSTTRRFVTGSHVSYICGGFPGAYLIKRVCLDTPVITSLRGNLVHSHLVLSLWRSTYPVHFHPLMIRHIKCFYHKLYITWLISQYLSVEIFDIQTREPKLCT